LVRGRRSAGWLTASTSTSTSSAGTEDTPGPAAAGPGGGEPDALADALVEPAAHLAHRWLDEATRLAGGRAERTRADRLHRLTADADSLAFAMAFCDRVLRPDSARVAGRQLRRLVRGAAAHGRRPRFLGATDRLLLALAVPASSVLPGVVMPLARRRLRSLVGDLVADATDPALAHHLARLRSEGFRVNLNLLGEAVLGHAEAARRRGAVIALMERADVDHVSVKVSSVCAQLNLWSYDETLERTKDALREIFGAASRQSPSTFVNLDMEEYKDLDLTLDTFIGLLDEEAFHGLEAGIVLQAYLPESLGALERLCGWAVDRRRRGGAVVKVRIVKGANLAAERVDAALHGWGLAPYATKAATDANHKAMVEYALRPEHAGALSVGIAGHNLFDLAWAHLLASARGMDEAVSFEMLHGMAPALARAVLAATAQGVDAGGGTGRVVLYTPVVAPDDFDHALAYLFRRLEENAGGENFLAALPDLGSASAFERERARFGAAVSGRGLVVHASTRRSGGDRAAGADVEFRNEPDSDPTDAAARGRVTRQVAVSGRAPSPSLPALLDETGIDEVVGSASAGAASWAAVPAEGRARLLEDCAEALEARRPELVALMAAEGKKTVGEADTEVSEAVDFARYYATCARELDQLDGARADPLGVVVVCGPWNFPLAIPTGGALAALAAGNAVVLKPAPQTPTVAFAAVQACWDAGVPRTALHYARCPDGDVGSRLVSHPVVSGLVLTGSYETARLFARLAPGRPLMAETSGKNVMVVMPEADLDQAAADLARSAFGHSGQKCSAASLAILVGETATFDRFRAQLVDAVRSLVLGPATSPATTMGPLVEPPSDDLRRALTTLEDDQHWLLQPRLIESDEPGTLWSPGIVDGVRPEDWFARTECFGPVLGLLSAHDLDEALEIQRGLPYGLTGGIWSLDPRDCAHWVDWVDVGNAYVNRVTTGAIVGRQPFGGWKRSVVGPGAKAGGPNYVLQMCRLRDEGTPTLRAEPGEAVRALVDTIQGQSVLHADELAALEAAAASDAYWMAAAFGTGHDPAGLFCEANVLRYRPVPRVIIRVAAGSSAPSFGLARTMVAAFGSGAGPGLALSLHPAVVASGVSCGDLPGVEVVTETADQLVARLRGSNDARVRLLGSEPELAELEPAVHVDARRPVFLGRVELLRYLREQTVSRTLHRYGNVVPAPDE
jgi:RHH-type proline utilization regulon transcriptional repressor/proline dehydrogenase/delta 1-pyrroline-5-carboxylate dehydrogenase